MISMDLGPVDDLDATATVAAARFAVRARRAADVQDLLVLAHWAVLHGTDPRDDPDPVTARAARAGMDYLIHLGGEGTPAVRESSLGEIAVARETGAIATSRALADVLDLQHRLPQTWRRVTDLTCEVWVARKIAALTRPLPLDRVDLVDAAVADAIGTEAPPRVLTLAQAKVIEADPAAHAAKLAETTRRRYVALSRVDETGLRTVIARVTAGDAAWIQATLDRAADLLAPDHPELTRDELRATALGLLARPAELLTLLLEGTQPDQPTDQPDEAEPDTAQANDPDPAAQGPAEGSLCRALAFPADLLGALRCLDPTQLRPRATVYLHLHEAVAAGLVPGTVRVENAGPLLPDQLRDLLAGAHVTLQPLIDLNGHLQTSAYEHPQALKERVWLTSRGDYFPHSTGSETRRVDYDHPTPYDPQGPPGQTGTHNSGPLRRRHHRWKTHAGYRARQIGPHSYLWATPHHHYYLVDPHGTHPIDPDTGHTAIHAPTQTHPGVWPLCTPDPD